MGTPIKQLKHDFETIVEKNMLLEYKTHATSTINPKILYIWSQLQRENADVLKHSNAYVYYEDQFINDLKKFVLYSN